MSKTTFIAVLILMAFSFNAFAEGETKFVPEDQLESARGDKKDGWYLKLQPGANFTFNDNRSVASQPDGYTLTFGLNFAFNAEMFKGSHELRFDLLLSEAVSKTPTIDDFFLSSDNLEIKGMYLYYFYKWFGLYGRAGMNVSLFPSYDLRAEQTTWAITKKDGTVERRSGKSKELTSFFSPLKLRQGLGPFFRPLTKEEVNIEVLLGFGFRENILDGNLSIDDNDSTSDIELVTLRNTYEIGAENINSIWGELWDKKISYRAYLDLFYPMYHDPDNTGLDAGDLLILETGTRWSFNIFEWMSIVYELKVTREFTVVNDWQIQNNLLFSLTYTYSKHFPKK